MWYCAFVSIVCLLSIWIISYGLMYGKNETQKTSIQVVLSNEAGINVTGVPKSKGKIKHHVPKFMLDLYENSKNYANQSTPEIVRSVIPTHAESVYQYFLEASEDDHHVLIFNLPKINKDEQFLKAELRVLTIVHINSTSLLGLERLVRISQYNEATRKLILLEEKHVYQRDKSWVTFNVSKAVKPLLDVSKTTILKLILTIKSFLPYVDNKVGVFKLSLMPIQEDYEHDYPVLLLFYGSDAGNRRANRIKRNAEEDYEEESNKVWDDRAAARRHRRMRNACKKKPLFVDFAEISYDTWIVQPSGYEAYQCSGKCFYPVADHLSPTKHAIIQALVHSVAPNRATRSCCVPTKLDPISVLYVDSQGVLTYRYGYKDMVVAECGCR